MYSDAELQLIDKYADVTDELHTDLHTDLHECLGHGSGKLLPGVAPDALKAYGSTIEEARADLFGLYYVADPKLVELGLTPSADAWSFSGLRSSVGSSLTPHSGTTYSYHTGFQTMYFNILSRNVD